MVGFHPFSARARIAPGPATFASSEPTTTPEPASAGVVRRALRGRRAAVRAWREWGRARACLSLRVVRFGAHSAQQPDRAESEAVWVGAGVAWRVDARAYGRRTDKLVERMRAPGGTSSGTRWAPLALWVGWSRACIPNLVYIIMRESSGRPTAVNSSSGCTGLLQILRSNVAQPWRLTEPEYNLREGLRLYRVCGWSPWAL